LEEAEGSKCKEIAAGDKEGQQPSKKARGKYCGGAAVRIGSSNPYKRYVCTGQNFLVHSSR